MSDAGVSRWWGLVAGLVAVSGICRIASADFSGTPITFKVDGGWNWIEDPRTVIADGQLVIGSVAGTTLDGATATDDPNGTFDSDINITDYNLSTAAISNFVTDNYTTMPGGESDNDSVGEADDHASPAFSVLPDGNLLVVYEGHQSSNDVFWRITSSNTANFGTAAGWSAKQTSIVNVDSDGNGNTYNAPMYLSIDNSVYDFSRAIGYDPNYSIFSNINGSNLPNFSYGGHYMYWQNPNNGDLTGGNGRPYVKYTSNGYNTVWLATTEDSPQNYDNSLYAGYIQFTASGQGTVYTSTGTALGPISTGEAPTGSANPPTSGGDSGPIASGTGYSYLPTQFTPIVEANANYNGVNLTGKYVGWASSMCLDNTGNPYLSFVVVDNLNGSYGNDLEYYYAHLIGGSWQVSRLGYGGYPLYNGQNEYAGMVAVDPNNPNEVYISADVNPVTDAVLSHYQIFSGISSDNGADWTWTQLTDSTSVDNVRPSIASGDGYESLTWLQGTYTNYNNYDQNVVGLIEEVPEPASMGVLGIAGLALLARRRRQSVLAA